MTNVANLKVTGDAGETKIVQIEPPYINASQLFNPFDQEQKRYWAIEYTYHFKAIINVLESAKKNAENRIIISETGTGKTYTKDCFMKRYPLHSYCITVDGMTMLNDIFEELGMLLGLQLRNSMAMRKRRIIQHLREIKLNGGQPFLIFDESENMQRHTLQMLKALYDGLKEYCGIVLIGTHQLINMLEDLKRRDTKGIPQLYSRFKAGIKILSPDVTDMGMFLDKYVEDKGLRKLLLNICNNYRELNTYLEPALRKSDLEQVPLTEDYFRIMYDMPKYSVNKKEQV